MNKKSGVIGFCCLILFFSMISFVSAQSSPIKDLITGIENIFDPILEAIFGQSEGLFEQLLLALVIVAVIYMALSHVEALDERPFALWVIAIVCAILGMRFIATNNFIELVMLPQGVLGVALLAVLPFLVYFSIH